VKEWRGEVVFLHEVIEGAAERSWGVHVAKLAGVPEAIVRRADALLRAAERTRSPAGVLPLFAGMEENAPTPVGVATGTGAMEWRTALADTDPDRLAPREALDLIYSWRRKFLGDAEPDAVNNE
ncbi:MAG TPA: DNA mismatch repair protein MutS, partial [Acidiphilium sp.]